MTDVSGRRLEDALRLLRSQGYENITVRLTAAPRLRERGYNADSRVIRQKLTAENTIELLVCNVNS